jgi:hypothetical protein
MVYHNKFVAVIKCNGKVLREREDNTVLLPFGSEYSILLKNLNSRAASVSISIDGVDVLNGRELIVQATSDLELERFLQDDMCHGNRFKFINKTQEIVNHRGDRVDDGIIRIEYRFEAAPPLQINYHHHHHHHNQWIRPSWWWNYDSPCFIGGAVYGTTLSSSRGMTGTVSCNYAADVTNCCDVGPAPDEGITVKGSESNQQFQQGYIGQLETSSEVIILRLRGVTGSRNKVTAPVTVNTKLTCPTCGRTSASAAKFCANCGTAL